MDFIFYHMVELEHMHHSDRGGLFKGFAGEAVVKLDTAITSKAGFF